jgi:branched-chain amino acid transport system permease protein
LSFVAAQILNGIATGMLYALMGLGLSLVTGILNIPNFAHGALFAVGAYLLVTVVGALGNFWLGLLIAPLGVALLGLVAWRIRARHSDNREAQRIARLQHEAAEVHRKLHRSDVAPQEYVANASRAVQLKAALARNLDPNAIDAESAANAFQLDEEKRNRLRQLFSESDEMRYSGGTNGGQTITPEKRREILELVDNLR